MKLEIFDPDETLDEDFGPWIIRVINAQFRHELNPKKLRKWNPILQEAYKDRLLSNHKLDAQTILVTGIKTLTCVTSPGKITIRFNKNIFVLGADRLRVVDVCKFINFGNTLVSGYPIITNVLTTVQDNIEYLVDRYRRVH